MKKIRILTAALAMSALSFVFFSCGGSTNSGSGPVDPADDVIPTDAVRFYEGDAPLSKYGVYGVEDLERLSEIVNSGEDDFEGVTIVVKKDIKINKKVLTDDFDAPAEGAEEGTPNPNLKNLDSIGKGASPTSSEIAVFKGTFDGNGKVISGLYIYQGHQALGFFGYVSGAVIKNVILVDACVVNNNMVPNPDPNANYPHDNKDDDRFGGLVGFADGDGVTIENCLFAGVVGSKAAKDRGDPYEYIGGLVGRAEKPSTAADCYVFARIYGSHADVVCGRYPDKEPSKFVGSEECKDNSIEITDYDEEIADALELAIEDAIATIKSNL